MQKYFPNTCRYVAQVLGAPNEEVARLAYIGAWMDYNTPVVVYQDDVIVIVAATNSLAVHAVRKENNNPVLGVNGNGEMYRWHGEAHHLFNHLFQLFQKAMEKVQAEQEEHNRRMKLWNEKK